MIAILYSFDRSLEVTISCQYSQISSKEGLIMSSVKVSPGLAALSWARSCRLTKFIKIKIMMKIYR